MKVHFNRVTLMREVQRVTYFLGIKTTSFSIHLFFSQLIRMHGFWQIPAQRAVTSNGNTNHDRARLHINHYTTPLATEGKSGNTEYL